MKLLIVEDELSLAQSIIVYLSNEHYVCEYAATYQHALAKIDMHLYDCILLDPLLPDGDGIRLINEMRTRNRQEGVSCIPGARYHSPGQNIRPFLH